MKNTIEKIENFISGTLYKFSSPCFGTPNSSYSKGYMEALKKIKEIIQNDNPHEYIGKYGYFWDSDMTQSCRYGRLVNCNEKYFYCNTENGHKVSYDNFSLTIPEHLK